MKAWRSCIQYLDWRTFCGPEILSFFSFFLFLIMYVSIQIYFLRLNSCFFFLDEKSKYTVMICSRILIQEKSLRATVTAIWYNSAVER